jgi:hypothetical protein
MDGNYIYLLIITIENSILETCQLLSTQIKNIREKNIGKNKLNGIKSILQQITIENILQCNFVFNSWLTYKNISFHNSYCKGIYTELEVLPLHHTTNTNFVIYHNDYYCLSNTLPNIHNTSFEPYLYNIIQGI